MNLTKLTILNIFVALFRDFVTLYDLQSSKNHR